MYKQKEREKSITKEEIVTTLHACAKKLGRVPTQYELSKMSRITIRHIQGHFGTFTQALRATGMEVGHRAVTASMSDLFRDWAAVARKAPGQLPSGAIVCFVPHPATPLRAGSTALECVNPVPRQRDVW